jgi:hypothetical protein
MEYYHGDTFGCSESIWNQEIYESNHKVILTINMPNKSLFEKDGYSNDWKRLIKEKDDNLYLKEEVLNWLNTNIKDRNKEPKKGWAIGSQNFYKNKLSYYEIFFEREEDALKFIKEWSEFKKPLRIFNGSTSRKQLNLTNMKYESF